MKREPHGRLSIVVYPDGTECGWKTHGGSTIRMNPISRMDLGLWKTAGKRWFSVALAAVAITALLSCGHTPRQAAPLDVESQWGEVGNSPGQLSYPRAIDSDDGTLWIIDKTARVQRLNPKTGECVGGWRMPEWELGKPTGLTVWRPRDGEHELVFVADTHYHRVMVYKADRDGMKPRPLKAQGGARPDAPDPKSEKGDLIASFGVYGTEPGQFIYPTDVAVLPTQDGRGIERVYVGEYGGNDRITVFEPPRDIFSRNGEYKAVSTIGSFGNGSSAAKVEFSRPQSIKLNLMTQEMIVTDACNHRVGRFTLDGELIAWIGTPGGGPGQLNYPYGLELVGDGTVLVVEFGGHRVQRFNLASGKSIAIYGQAGRGAGQISSPWGVAILGRVAYLLDSGNNRVTGFRVR